MRARAGGRRHAEGCKYDTLLGARTLLGAPGLTTSNKKLLETRIRIQSSTSIS